MDILQTENVIWNYVVEVSIINPANISSFIHLFFDPTHILKCVYNNLFTRELLKFPDFAGELIEANFDQIASLNKMEFGNRQNLHIN